MSDVLGVALITGLVSVVGSVLSALVALRTAKTQEENTRTTAGATKEAAASQARATLEAAIAQATATSESAAAQAEATRNSANEQARATIATSAATAESVRVSADIARQATVRVEAQKRFAEWQQYKREIYITAIKATNEYRASPSTRAENLAREALLTAQLVADDDLADSLDFFVKEMDQVGSPPESAKIAHLITEMNTDARSESSQAT